MAHRAAEELDAARRTIDASPTEVGTVEMVVVRPANGVRRELRSGRLDCALGLVGDNWKTRGNARTDDGAADAEAQLTLMNARVIDALSGGDRSRWARAGDQLFVDLSLHPDYAPAGTRLRVGEAVVEITSKPHRGCAKFSDRFGVDALRFVNTGLGGESRYRGVNARVITPGVVRAGDQVAVTSTAAAGTPVRS